MEFRVLAIGDVTSDALLAEGVDRNMSSLYSGASSAASPSSRRAWIEIAEGRAA